MCQGQVGFFNIVVGSQRSALLYDACVNVLSGSGNFVVPIIDGEGRLAAFYTPDQTPPRLLNYTINMDSGKQRFDRIQIQQLAYVSGCVC